MELTPEIVNKRLDNVDIVPTDRTVNPTDSEIQDISIFNEEEVEEESNLSDNTWTPVLDTEKKALGFIKTDNFIFETSNGTTIEVEDKSTIQIKENLDTGEIIIIGAVGAKIKSSDTNTKISIYDSDIKSLDTKKGNDEIYIENSTIEDLDSGKGHDNITLENSTIEKIDSGKGNDNIVSYNSTIESVKLGKDEDYLYANNSHIGKLKDSKGDVDIMIDESTVTNVNLATAENRIIFENNSTIGKFDAGNGLNDIRIEDSTIEDYDDHKHDDVKDIDTNTQINVQELDEVSQVLATDILNNKVQEYSEHTLSAEEQTQALTIDFFNQNLNNIKAQLEEQQSSDGVINESYNFVKELTDLGVSIPDVEAAIKEEEEMINEFKAALNGEIDESFEDVFKKWTGVEYNEENILAYQEKAQIYSLATTGLAKANAFNDAILKSNNLAEINTLFTDYYGSEELGLEKFNEYLNQNQAIWSNYGWGTNIQSIEVKDNKLFYVSENPEYLLNPEAEYFKEFAIDLTNVPNVIQDNIVAFDQEYFAKEFLSNFEETTNINFDDLQRDFADLQLKAYGKSNSFQRLIDKYCKEQEGFADAITTLPRYTGLGLMLGGGALSYVCPPIGIGAMKVGHYLTMFGMFGDNAIETVDGLTSEKGIDEKEADKIFKETLTEAALYYSGKSINVISGTVNAEVLNATNSQLLATIAEVGTDAPLSLLADYIITGEVDLTGEGINQLLCVLSGIAGSKLKDISTKYKVESKNFYDSQKLVYENLKNTTYNDSKLGVTDALEKCILDFNKRYASNATVKRFIEETLNSEIEKGNISAEEAINSYISIIEYKNLTRLKLDDAFAYRRTLVPDNTASYTQDINNLINEGFDKKIVKEAFETLHLTPDEAAIYCAYRKADKNPIESYKESISQDKAFDAQDKLEYAKKGLNIYEISSLRSYRIPISKIDEYKRIKAFGFKSTTDIIHGLKANLSDAELVEYKKICDLLYDKNPMDGEALEVYKLHLTDEQLERVMNIKDNSTELGYYSYPYCAKFASLGFDDAEIKRFHNIPSKYKISIDNARTYFKALDANIPENSSVLLIKNGCTADEVNQFIENLPKIKEISTHFSKLLNYNTMDSLMYGMAQNKILDPEAFYNYAKSINYKELVANAPQFKDYNSQDRADFLCYHYRNGTTEFTKEALGLDKNLTSYLTENYLNADGLNRLLQLYPLSSKQVGEMPSGLLDSIERPQQEVIDEMYSVITNFTETSDVDVLTKELTQLLNKEVKIKIAGSGALGDAYKVDIEGLDPLCLKIFKDNHDPDLAYNKHGARVEPQNGLYANNHSNNFVKMFFGQIAGKDANGAFMVTQFLGEGITPIKTGYNMENGLNVNIADNHDGNYRNGKIIDFGAMIIEQDGKDLHDWGY